MKTLLHESVSCTKTLKDSVLKRSATDAGSARWPDRGQCWPTPLSCVQFWFEPTFGLKLGSLVFW